MKLTYEKHLHPDGGLIPFAMSENAMFLSTRPGGSLMSVEISGNIIPTNSDVISLKSWNGWEVEVHIEK